MASSRASRRRAAHQLPRIQAQSDARVGAYNHYICPAGHVTVTIDRDAGVTPAFMPCPHEATRGFPAVTVVCELRAASGWYRVPQAEWRAEPARQATHEWYRPDDDERRHLDAYQADHVNRGGLLLRRVCTPVLDDRRRGVMT